MAKKEKNQSSELIAFNFPAVQVNGEEGYTIHATSLEEAQKELHRILTNSSDD